MDSDQSHVIVRATYKADPTCIVGTRVGADGVERLLLSAIDIAVPRAFARHLIKLAKQDPSLSEIAIEEPW